MVSSISAQLLTDGQAVRPQEPDERLRIYKPPGQRIFEDLPEAVRKRFHNGERRILILDDETATTDDLGREFSHLYPGKPENILTASNPQQATQILIQEAHAGRPIDAIVLDLFLGDGNKTGLEFLKDLRQEFVKIGKPELMPAVVVNTGSMMSQEVLDLEDKQDQFLAINELGDLDKLSADVGELQKEDLKGRLQPILIHRKRPDNLMGLAMKLDLCMHRRDNQQSGMVEFLDGFDPKLIEHSLSEKTSHQVVEKLCEGAKAIRRVLDGMGAEHAFFKSGWWDYKGGRVAEQLDKYDDIGLTDVLTDDRKTTEARIHVEINGLGRMAPPDPNMLTQEGLGHLTGDVAFMTGLQTWVGVHRQLNSDITALHSRFDQEIKEKPEIIAGIEGLQDENYSFANPDGIRVRVASPRVSETLEAAVNNAKIRCRDTEFSTAVSDIIVDPNLPEAAPDFLQDEGKGRLVEFTVNDFGGYEGKDDMMDDRLAPSVARMIGQQAGWMQVRRGEKSLRLSFYFRGDVEGQVTSEEPASPQPSSVIDYQADNRPEHLKEHKADPDKIDILGMEHTVRKVNDITLITVDDRQSLEEERGGIYYNRGEWIVVDTKESHAKAAACTDRLKLHRTGLQKVEYPLRPDNVQEDVGGLLEGIGFLRGDSVTGVKVGFFNEKGFNITADTDSGKQWNISSNAARGNKMWIMEHINGRGSSNSEKAELRMEPHESVGGWRIQHASSEGDYYGMIRFNGKLEGDAPVNIDLRPNDPHVSSVREVMQRIGIAPDRLVFEKLDMPKF